MDELSAYVAFCALVEDILPADYYTNLEGSALFAVAVAVAPPQ